MFAAEHEIHDALHEGVTILDGVMPVEIMKGDDGRATGMKVCDCTMDGMTPIPVEGTERVLEADLIVAAIGQGGDMDGLDDFNNGKGLMDTDKNYQVVGKPGHFAIGDIVRPHLLTTAIGHASVASESIDAYLKNEEQKKRPKVDVHFFDLEEKMEEAGLTPDHFDPSVGDMRGTSGGNWAIHNYEDRSFAEIIGTDGLFLGYFENTPRNLRSEDVPSADDVLGHFHERMKGLDEATAQAEAKRCMSSGSASSVTTASSSVLRMRFTGLSRQSVQRAVMWQQTMPSASVVIFVLMYVLLVISRWALVSNRVEAFIR
jgi:hypothetical protein